MFRKFFKFLWLLWRDSGDPTLITLFYFVRMTSSFQEILLRIGLEMSQH